MMISKLKGLAVFEELLYNDGPILTHLRDAGSDDHYFTYWVGETECGHRWLVFKVLFDDVLMYVNGLKGLRALISESADMFLTDVENNDYANVRAVCTEEVSEYLPDGDSLFHLRVPDRYKKERGPVGPPPFVSLNL